MVLEVALCCNFLHGPFNADGNFQDLQGAAEDLFAHMTPEDELWQAFHMPIAKDIGVGPLQLAGDVRGASCVMQAAQGHDVLRKKGDRVKLSRWFSVWDRYEEKLENGWNILLLVLLYSGLAKGWFAVSDEFKVFAMRRGASLISATSTELAGGGSDTRSVAASSDVLGRLRAACANTAHVVATILANTMSQRLFAGMNIFVQVVRAAHGKAMVLSKSPEETLKYRVHVALGRWASELVDIARVACDPAALSKARFLQSEDVQGPQSWQEGEDDRAAELLFTFVVHLLASRIVHSCCLSETFPWKASALLSDQPEDLAGALAEMSVWWEKLE